MDYQEFETYAQDAAALAERDFPKYRRNVGLFAALGYVVIFAILLVLVGLVGGVIATAIFSTGLLLILLKTKIVWLLAPMIWILLRALWVRFDAPEGYEIDRERFPALFGELDDLRQELDALRVHQVILTPELNAAVVQTPRFGMFGGQRNTLIIGLELLLTMTPAQARSVLAHELGHLSGNHSAFAARIYRVRTTWHKVLNGLNDRDNFGARLMFRFFDWYAPRFSAYSFALARQNEYEADEIASRLTSPTDTGEALVNVNVTAPFVDENYWTAFFRSADDHPSPTHLPWSGLHQFLKTEPDGLNERLNGALDEQTDFSDTHPSLSDRLQALRVTPAVPPPVEESAAHVWLGAQYQEVIDDFDKLWLERNAEPWKNRFEYVKEGRERLAALQLTDSAALDDETLWELGLLSEQFAEPNDAISVMREYQKRYPQDEDAAFVLARNLYELDDPECLSQCEIACRRPALGIETCAMAYYFCQRNGLDEQLKRWETKHGEAQTVAEEIELERQQLTHEDQMIEPDLDHEVARLIIERLQEHGIKRAWLGQKMVTYYPESPAFAVAFKIPMLSRDRRVIRRVTEALEGIDVWIIPQHDDYQALADHIIKHGRRIS